MSTRTVLGLMAACCCLLSACGSGEAAVQKAAQQRWDALIAGDFHRAYQFYSEAYQETVSLDSFRKQIQGVGFWKKAQVQKVHCGDSSNLCKTEVEVTVAMKMRGLPKPVETSDVVREVWIKDGFFSDWRYVKK
ncbi:MAG: hypothetical protein CR991_03900 [Proteobacteria bacterium]|nr:MAG: hypothetical protein CR991_03900 [Pseudomonadota bacterium]